MKSRPVFTVALIVQFLAATVLPAQIAVVSETVVEHGAQPGEVYRGRLELLNTGKTAQEAKLYQTDYQFFADGRSNYAAPGSSARSNARWIVFSPNRVSLVPGARATVAYTVSVPTAPLKGSYWSMLMVETIPLGFAESSVTAPHEIRVGIQTKVRYAAQLVTNIGLSGSSAIRFDSVTVTRDNRGRKGVSFDFVNTGERAHRLTLSLQLYSPGGALVKTLEQTRGLLYPGTSARQRFDLGSLPPGAYKALIVADGGGDEMFGGEYILRF